MKPKKTSVREDRQFEKERAVERALYLAEGDAKITCLQVRAKVLVQRLDALGFVLMRKPKGKQ